MMDESKENSTEAVEKSEMILATSLGTMLREAREHLGLSVIDVANQIKFAPRQIEALEADEFKNLNEDAFLRGFVRSYAKILQLDAQTLLATIPHKNTVANGGELPAVPSHADSIVAPRYNLNWLLAAALLAVIAGIFGLWNFISPPAQPLATRIETPVTLPEEIEIISEEVAPVEPEQPSLPNVRSKLITVQPVQTPELKSELRPEVKPEVNPKVNQVVQPRKEIVASDSKPVPSAPATQVRLEFGEESWTEIRDRDGEILSSQVNPAGSELIVYGQAPFTLLIGHGLSARLFHQGNQVDLTPYINKFSEVAHVTLK